MLLTFEKIRVLRYLKMSRAEGIAILLPQTSLVFESRHDVNYVPGVSVKKPNDRQVDILC